MIRSLFAVALVSALVPACVDPWAQEPPPSGDFVVPGGDGCFSASGMSSYVLDAYASCGEGTQCPVAVGGRNVVTIYPSAWEFADLDVDGVFTREPATGVNESLRATAPGKGHVELHAYHCGTHDEALFWPMTLSALPVETVRVQTADQVYTYNPADAYVSYSTDRVGWRVHDTAVVTLSPAGAGTTAPKYLTDSSIAIAGGESALYRITANRYEIEQAGTFDISVTGESFGQRTFQLHAFDHVDRIEGEVVQAPVKAGDKGEVCFHAFAGDYEVALADYDFTGALTYTANIKQPRRNCLAFQALHGGTGHVTVTADGLEKTVDFTFEPL